MLSCVVFSCLVSSCALFFICPCLCVGPCLCLCTCLWLCLCLVLPFLVLNHNTLALSSKFKGLNGWDIIGGARICCLLFSCAISSCVLSYLLLTCVPVVFFCNLSSCLVLSSRT
jgi:hypothetical protein